MDEERKKQKWWIYLIVIAVLAILVWLGYKFYQKQHDLPATMSFPTTQVRKGEMDVKVSGSGSIQPITSVDVSPITQGTIKEILVKEGDMVKKGDVIAKLDNQDISDQINQNQFNLEKDKLDINQNQEKIANAKDQDTIDNLNIEIKKTQLDMEQIREKIASLNEQAKDSEIVSPVAGKIVTLNAKIGDSVGPNAAIAHVTDYTSMQMVTQVDELDISKVKIGQNANITIDALQGQTFTGKVTDIADEGVSNNGVATFDVTILLNNLTNIKAGMSAEASILVESKKDILMLPIEAIQTSGNRSFVMVPRSTEQHSSAKQKQNNQLENARRNYFISGKGNRKEVQVGIHNEDYIEIVSGLNEGDRVIIPTTTDQNNQSQMRMGGFGGFGRGLSGGGNGFGGKNKDTSGDTNRGGNQ